MRASEIENHRRRTPFQPFRIFLSNGQSHDVRHPEMIYVSRTEVIVAVELGKDQVVERSAYCDPDHISNIEPINGEPPLPRSSNGA